MNKVQNLKSSNTAPSSKTLRDGQLSVNLVNSAGWLGILVEIFASNFGVWFRMMDFVCWGSTAVFFVHSYAYQSMVVCWLHWFS
jgi:hypothetical protein